MSQILESFNQFIMKKSAESALMLCEEVNDPWGIVYSRALIASHLMRLADFKACKPLLERSLNEFKNLGDVWGESFVLGLLGRLYLGIEGMKKSILKPCKRESPLHANRGTAISLPIH